MQLHGNSHKIVPNLSLLCPGNAGTALVGSNLALSVTDIDGLTDWCKQEQPDLVVIGPEAPLCAGLTMP